MIKIDGEITETSCPPNKADVLRTVTVWLPEQGEELELTVYLTEFQRDKLKEGDHITISIEKKLDLDSLAQNFFKGPQ